MSGVSSVVTGWKTYLAGVGAMVLGFIIAIRGDGEHGAMVALAGLGLIGLGHKAERVATALEETL